MTQPDPTAGTAADAAPWQRVHPLTPAVRSWQALVVLVVFIGQGLGQNVIGGQFGGPDEGWSPADLVGSGGTVLLTGGGIAVLVLVLAALAAVLSWRMTRYRITAEALELHRGVLFRQQRRAQLDRLQAVDVVQPLVARIFGLARLTVEVAGSGDSRIELAYLTHTQALELRNRLLASAAGVTYETEQAPAAQEHQWLEVPLSRLVASMALSPGVMIPVLIVAGLVATSAFLRDARPLTGALPTVLGFGGLVWSRFTGGFGFRVATAPDGLRLRHGLLEQRTQTVPPGRVQAVRLSQPLLWRRRDWWRVQVNVAGYGNAGGEGRGDTESTLLPVGTRDEAVAVLAFVLPDLGVGAGEHPRTVVDAGLSGSGNAAGFATSPRAARWLDWFSWRRNGFRVTDRALLVRRGYAERQLDVVPHARTQSCGLTQGPVQRRLGLVSFALHSTAGPVSAVVDHLAASVGAALLDEQARRASHARATAGPERWMAAQAARAVDELAGGQNPVEG